MSDRATSFTSLFIRRPVLALVVNALIVVAGLAAFGGVEVRELPDVDRPVVTVTTDYDGSAPETIDKEVTSEIESAIARVPGVKSISSSSSFGRSRVTVEFNENIDLNVAASDLRDAVSRIANSLPDDAEEPRIVKADSDSQAVLRIAVTADGMSTEDLTTLVKDEIEERLLAVDGVADLQIYGDRERIIRIDIDQAKLASRGLSIADLRSALDFVSLDVPAGTLTSSDQDLIVRANANISSAAQFEAIIVKGSTRLGDIATVAFGPDTESSQLRANGRTGVGIGVVRQAQSNTLQISRGVRQAVDRIRGALPSNVDIQVTSDDAIFINGAINEVVKTLVIATLIVVAVIFLFLRDWRATLIPAITLPIALIGTLAAIYLVGFSINILTLLAFVLATGMVVDDAIVVLENIVRRRAEGMSPRAAAILGVREVFFAILSTTATLAAVFVPIAFLPGAAGSLFTEFGFVLAIAVVISSFVALTLCPMLASRLLKGAERDTGRPASLAERGGAAFARIFARSIHAALAAPVPVLAAAVAFAGISYVVFRSLPVELTPPEDRSVLLMRISAPQGVSLDFTLAQMARIESMVQPLVQAGEVRNVFAFAGRGGASNGFMVLTLAPWDQRARSQQQIAADVNGEVSKLPGVRAFAIQPNSLGIRGGGQGLQFALAGTNFGVLEDAASKMIEVLEADPRFGSIRLSYETTQPQLSVTIDRERASDLGIAIDGLAAAIQAVLDGREIGSVYVEDKAVPIKIVSTAQPINDPSDLENVFLRTSDGRTVPMSSIATIEERAVAPSLQREQRLRAVPIIAGLTPGFALRDAMVEVERFGSELLPPGVRILPLAEAATLDETSGGIAVTFGFAIIIVLLVLAAQFESFISALIIVFTVPFGLACAVLAILLTGGSLNIYSQIGLVMLVGIMAKNGILIVEFANQLRDRGYSLRRAIEEACRIRLRPVLMTMISTVCGGIPLVISAGAGAEARVALGWIVVGGLGFATIATLYLTPVGYLLLARFSKPRAEQDARLQHELDEAVRMVDEEQLAQGQRAAAE